MFSYQLLPRLKCIVLMPILALFASSSFAQGAITVYSARSEPLLLPLLKSFTEATGIQVKLHTDNEAALLARLQSEAANTPADVLITVDAGNLWQAAQLNLLKPINSTLLQATIPAHLRDPQNRWFGLSVRARTIVYNKNLVKPEQLSTYEQLADATWKGKLCLRTSKKVYNQSLVALLIAEYGETKTEALVHGWVQNLAAQPFADDTALLKAIAAEQCQVGLANTYYLARLIDQDANFPVGLFWANQTGSGVHVNVSGAGVTTHSKNASHAQKLLEFLASDRAQAYYTDSNFEFPANTKIKPSSIIKQWGEFKPNTINVSRAGELQAAAIKLMDRVSYR